MAMSASAQPAVAQARKASCPSSDHSPHPTHACGHSGRKLKADGNARKAEDPPKAAGSGRPGSAPRKARAGRGSKRAHSKRGGAKKKAQDRASNAAQKGVSQVAAICEDGSVPIRAHDGSFSCDDGSEPGCENGSEPILSGDRSALVCEVGPGEGAAPGPGDPSEEIPTEEGSPDEVIAS